MRIVNSGEDGPDGKLYDCQLYVRRDLTVVEATERYYRYVGDNSYLPISELLYSEDAKILREAADNFTGEVELITGITNRRDGYRSVYLRMESSDHTEKGKPLYRITFFNMRDLENRNGVIEKNLAKYRRFMSLNNQYFFEYTRDTRRIVVYKYVNDKAMQIVNSDLEEYAREQNLKAGMDESGMDQMRTFCNYLTGGAVSFDMEFIPKNREAAASCRVRGGVMYKDDNLIVGILTPDQMTVKEAYYLTPAARDAGTGLLNKKAATEYSIERLQCMDGKVRWIIMIDIDDFKSINDRFGHLFGDEVIRKVSEILRQVVSFRGVIGRFGGDEFFILLEDVQTREDLKVLLKTVAKHLYNVYEPRYNITCSIGIAQYPKDGRDYEQLLGKADKALYIAKEKGKNRHIIYDEKLHGAYDKDNLRVNAVAFSLSKEKRTAAIIDLITNLYARGITYMEEEQVQNRLREVFDLDGISIFTDGGKRLLCRSGDYIAGAVPEVSVGLKDESFLKLFDESGVLVESNMLKLRAAHAAAYEAAMKQETGALILCLGRKNRQAHSLVQFDVLNRNRKWSDSDVEMLSLIGSCINQLLCRS